LDDLRVARNVQGLAALEMLNIMETFPLGQKDWASLDQSPARHDRAKKAGVRRILRNTLATRGNRNCPLRLLSKEWERKGQLIDRRQSQLRRDRREIPVGKILRI